VCKRRDGEPAKRLIGRPKRELVSIRPFSPDVNGIQILPQKSVPVGNV
jgi:hypothetical protein